MKHDLELKVQAWVDGELSERETARIGEWIARDPEASALAAELQDAKQVVASSELSFALPESREFYWSKIQRQLQSVEHTPRPALGAWAWQRFLMPLAGVAAIVCASLIVRMEMKPPAFDETSATGGGMEAITFHDQSADMTVVWLQDRAPAVQNAASRSSAPVSIPDPGEIELQ